MYSFDFDPSIPPSVTPFILHTFFVFDSGFTGVFSFRRSAYLCMCVVGVSVRQVQTALISLYVFAHACSMTV